jgi:hypothetical protein
MNLAELPPVVHRDVADAAARAVALYGNREAHLVLLRTERPLLRERREPAAQILGMHEGRDVLYDARLLIVRFLDQEGVVHDRLDVALCMCRDWRENREAHGAHAPRTREVGRGH